MKNKVISKEAKNAKLKIKKHGKLNKSYKKL